MRFQFFETFIIGNAELPNSQAGKELGLLAVSLHGKDSQSFQAESSEFSFSFIHEGLDRLPTVISQTNSLYTFQSLLCMTSQFVFPIEYHCMMVYEETSGLKREPKTDKKDCTLFSTCSFISFRFKLYFLCNHFYLPFTDLPTNEMFLRYPLSWNKCFGCSTIVGYPWRMLTSSMLMARQ